MVAVKAYLETKDEDGTEYRITTIVLGDKDPVVMLESTSAEEYKPVNLLNAEFAERNFPVWRHK